MSAAFVRLGLLALLTALGLALFGCEDEKKDGKYQGFEEKKVRPGMSSVDAADRLKKTKGTGLLNATAEKPGSTKIDLPQLTEISFISGAKNRDPFFPFLEVLGETEEMRKLEQRDVKLKEYDISDLRLIGIITNIDDPRAMVTTPDNVGFVLRRGDYVGRADFVKQGRHGEAIQVNWRVAQIHGSGKEEERGVYLVRDDPTTTKGVDVTRFLQLHPQ